MELSLAVFPTPVCEQFGSCYAVPQEALCCPSLRDTHGYKSPSSLQCSRAHPVPSLPGQNELLKREQ